MTRSDVTETFGECPGCTPDTTLTEDPEHPGVWVMQVEHEERCRVMRAKHARGN